MQISRLIQNFLITFLSIISILKLCNSLVFSPRPPPLKKVIVTGAAGRTGKLVFMSLLKNSKFYPMGLVRSEKSAKQLIKETVCGLENLWVCDITQLYDSYLPNDFKGAEAIVICTSAVPKLRKRSLVKAIMKIPFHLLTGKKAIDFRQLKFYYAEGQNPEEVDYMGQIAQIDLAKKCGIPHVVLVSSLGGTNPDDFLNSIGKDENGNGGDILIWKRKAEKYLIESGLRYTIIHPGGLNNRPGGMMELKLDVNDIIMKTEKSRSISRCDVARLCVASLSRSNGKSYSFDCVNVEIPEGSVPRSTEAALREFLQQDPAYLYESEDKLLITQ